jgi:hypothetical protein
LPEVFDSWENIVSPRSGDFQTPLGMFLPFHLFKIHFVEHFKIPDFSGSQPKGLEIGLAVQEAHDFRKVVYRIYGELSLVVLQNVLTPR